jgi:tRNA A37 threonylcarbamoyladenosine dehydratase
MKSSDPLSVPSSNPQFSGLERLWGKQGADRIRKAHVAIIGVGGVGSWVAEALARSGIGTLTLVDMDEVCMTNINRQVHALSETVGQPKVEAMAKRIRSISADVRVETEFRFFTAETAPDLLNRPWQGVVDCIDGIPHKCLLISECKRLGIPVVTVGAAGGRRDPTRIQVADLSRTYDDALLQRVRKKLRQKFGFPRNTRKKWKIPAVFSSEPVVFPQSDGSVCDTREEGSNLRLDCASGYGTASFVTGAFGFAAAAAMTEVLLEE